MPDKKQTILHKKSGVANKIPTSADCQYGEITVNYNANSPQLAIKKSDNSIAIFKDKTYNDSSYQGKGTYLSASTKYALSDSVGGKALSAETLGGHSSGDFALLHSANTFTEGQVISRNTSGAILELTSTASSTNFLLTRGGGSQCVLEAGNSVGLFGTKSNHPLQIRTNYTNRMTIGADGSVTLATDVSDSSNDNQVASTKWVNSKLSGYAKGSYLSASTKYALSDSVGGKALSADTLDGYHADSFSKTGHTHAISDVTNLQTTLNGKSDTGHTHSQYSLTSHTHAGVYQPVGSYLSASTKYALSDSVGGIALSADTLDGYHASSFSLTSHTHDNYSLTSHTHSNYSLTSHTHSYLPLSGGTMSGSIDMNDKGIENCSDIEGSGDNDVVNFSSHIQCTTYGFYDDENEIDGNTDEGDNYFVTGHGHLVYGLDGYRAMDKNNYKWGAIPVVYGDGVMEIGGYIDFHTTSTDTSDYAARITCQTGTSRQQFILPQTGGTLVTTLMLGGYLSASTKYALGATTGGIALSADTLDGYHASSFSLTSHTHDNYSLTSHTHSNYSLTSHTHSYLPLSGGTLTGNTTMANSKKLIFSNGTTEGFISEASDGSLYIDNNGNTVIITSAVFITSGITANLTTDRASNKYFATDGSIQTALTGSYLTATTTYALGATKGGIALSADTLDGYHASSFSKTGHTHAISDVTNLQSTLDGKSGTGHTHSNYSLTSHTHDGTYLPLTGGTMSGEIDMNGNTIQINSNGSRYIEDDGDGLRINSGDYVWLDGTDGTKVTKCLIPEDDLTCNLGNEDYAWKKICAGELHLAYTNYGHSGSNYGGVISFGDYNDETNEAYTYIREEDDDNLVIHANTSVKIEGLDDIILSANSSSEVSVYGSALRVNSSVYSTNGFYQTSDERKKNFLGNIEIDFDKLGELPKKYFIWKEDKDGKVNIGTSAQAVQKVYPELVHEDEDGSLTVAYDKLSIIALAAIDKQQKEIEDLKSQLKEIKDFLGMK